MKYIFETASGISWLDVNKVWHDIILFHSFFGVFFLQKKFVFYTVSKCILSETINTVIVREKKSTSFINIIIVLQCLIYYIYRVTFFLFIR